LYFIIILHLKQAIVFFYVVTRHRLLQHSLVRLITWWHGLLFLRLSNRVFHLWLPAVQIHAFVNALDRLIHFCHDLWLHGRLCHFSLNMSSILLFWCKHLRRRHVLGLDVHRLESKVNLRCLWDKWLETKVNLGLVIRDRRLVRLFVLKLVVLVLVRNHVARAEIVFELWLLLFLISLLCVESVRNGRLQDLFGRVLIDQRLLIRQQHRPELVRIVLDRRTLGRHRLGILKVLLSNGKLLLALLVIRQSLPLLLQR
jgi:hypothetical protein